MLARSPEQWKDLALSYGPLAAVVWGIALAVQAFQSPLTTEWKDWCVLLVGGMAAAILVPLALATGAGWIARRPRRDRQMAG